MCRANTGPGKGRRCACDTSEARLARRHNAKLRAKYQDQVRQPTPASHPPHVELTSSVTVEMAKQSIDSLNAILDQGRFANDADVDKAVITVGEQLATLAEEQFGAPTDNDFENLPRPPKVFPEDKEFTEAVVAACNQLGIDPKSVYKGTRVSLGVLAKAGISEEDHRKLERLQTADRQARKDWSDHYYTSYKSLLLKRGEAIRQALEAAGVQLADPSTIVFHERSNKRAMSALRSVLSFYPQEWVDASNERQPILAKQSTTQRAHYATQAMQEKSTSQLVRKYIEGGDWEPPKYGRASLEYTLINPDPDGKYIDPATSKDVSDSAFPGYPLWAHQEYAYRVKRSPDEKPPASGPWEEITVEERTYSDGTWQETSATYWRQAKKVRRKEFVGYADEIVLDSGEEVATTGARGNPIHRVAIHELAHRFEHAVPRVVVAERAFLNRRKGDGSLELVYPDATKKKSSSVELGFRDNFVNAYMGKIYDGGKHYELLSVGMESIFAGSNEGLSPTPNTFGMTSDPDYRKFVLGTLTIRARNKEA